VLNQAQSLSIYIAAITELLQLSKNKNVLEVSYAKEQDELAGSHLR